MDRTRCPGNVDAPQEVRAGAAARSSRASTPPASRRKAAAPSTRCSAASTNHEARTCKRRSGARRGVRPTVGRRGHGARSTSTSIPYSPIPGRFRSDNSPWMREPMEALVDPKIRIVSHHRRDPERQDQRRRTRPLPHHRQPARARRCGSIRPTTTPRTRARAGCRSSSTNARRCARSIPGQPAQAPEQRDPFRQRHDAVGARGPQQDQPPAPLDPLARSAMKPGAGRQATWRRPRRASPRSAGWASACS